MALPNKFRITFKVISALMAGIFLFEQVALAGDLVNAALERQYKEQSQTFAPAYLQNQQNAAESLVSQKQAIADAVNTRNLTNPGNTQPPPDETLDLKGPRGGSGGGEAANKAAMKRLSEGGAISQDGAVLSVTTRAGDVIHYKDGRIDSIEKSDGTILRNLTLNENNDLLGAEIIHPDGTAQIIANGKVSRVIKPDGAILNYNDDELISSIIYPDGRTANCSYVKDIYGEVIETILADPEKTSYYDSNNRLTKVEFNNGKRIEYENGALSKAVDIDGTAYLYETTEFTQGDVTEYAAKLKTIISASGVKYHIDNNNINSIELSDKSLSNFNLDETGRIINGEINYPDNTKILVENYKIKEFTGANGIRTTYQYSPDGLICDAAINDHGRVNIYRYIKNPAMGKFTIEDGNKNYEYNSLWQLERFENDSGAFRYSYDAGGNYLAASFASSDGAVRQYDANQDLTETILPPGAVYTYYKSGAFQGKPEQAVLPDGKIVYYDYSVTAEGNLKVYKRLSYGGGKIYQGIYSNNNIDYSLNPALKFSFKLDSSKTSSSVYAYASYYDCNDKSINLSLSIYDQSPAISYCYYDYKTGQYTSDSKTLSMAINRGVAYNMEYIWTGSAVNIYIYESSEARPANPAYTITNYRWNPCFSIGGSNANIILDSSSNGRYTNYRNISTDYTDPLKGGPIHTTSFTFDSAAGHKSLYYRVYGNTDSSSDSIDLHCYDNTSTLSVYHYDSKAHECINKSIPLNITFNDNTTYIIRTKVEDNTLKVYIYEEGTAPGGPVYTIDNVSWDPEIHADITGGDLNVEASDRLQTYEYNGADGRLIKYARRADDELLTYIYDAAGSVIRKELILSGGAKKIYDEHNRLLSETKANGETTLYEYGPAGNVISITPRFPEGTAYTYYSSGAFQGKLKIAALPDGKTVYYDYGIAENGNLKVYKRVSYDDNNIEQYFYTKNYINSSLNPALKASFEFDSAKNYSSVYAHAYYYNRADKHVSLSLNVYAQKSRVSYYYYDYKSGQRINDSRELNITIKQDTAYNIEYVWSQNNVNIYLYEASKGRPANPVYTISNSKWNPRFSFGGNNAGIILNPSSSGAYTVSKSISTDYTNPLKGSPVHTSAFKFDALAVSKSLYYSIYGNTASSGDSIYLYYYNNTAILYTSHYDRKTHSYVNDTIPLNAAFADNTNYTIRTKIENNTLKLYIYESASAPAAPVYTMENASWDPQVYSSISGGDITVGAWDRLEAYEYNTASGIMLDKDAESAMRNKNIIIDDPYRKIPEYALISGAPLIFPDGKTDISSGAVPNIDFSVILPGNVFDLNGDLITAGDFKDIPYFDTITYGQNRTIKELSDPAGNVIGYKDGLVDSVLSGSAETTYGYTFSASGDIEGITVDRDGIKRIYDKYGNISSITANNIFLALNNGQITRVEKEDGTIIEDATFDSDNNIISAKITSPEGVEALYSGGVLIEARQPDGGTFYYDASGNITKLVNGEGLIYLYSIVAEGGQTFMVANLENADSIQDIEEIVYQKYDSDKRLLQAKRKNGETLDYSYIFDITGKVISTIVSDSKIKTTYDENNNIVKTEVLPTADDPVSTISEYEYSRIRRVYKSDDLIYRYTYEFDADSKEVTVIEDVGTGDFKRYKDEMLISVTSAEKLITSYEYSADKKILKSTIVNSGKVISIYAYSYDGDNTIIEDMDGVKRTYNKDNKLIFLEENRKTYAYTYQVDDGGNEETLQELISVKDDAGSVANYEKGVLISITKPDGVILGDFVFSPDGSIQAYSILKDGVKYFIQNDKVIKEIRADNTIIEYNADGLVSSVSESTGRVTQYNYEYSGQGQIDYIVVTKDGLRYRYDINGMFIEMMDGNNNHYYYDDSNKLIEVADINKQIYDLSYDNNTIFINSFHEIKQSISDEIANFSSSNLAADISNNKSEIKLDRNYLFDYGDGSDGDLQIETGQTVVIDGTKNYKNVYVASGATLTVSPWNGITGGSLQIKCLGQVVIDGFIRLDTRGYMGGNGYSGSVNGNMGDGTGKQGESYLGIASYSTGNNYGGGGGGRTKMQPASGPGYAIRVGGWTGGSGGSYGTNGQSGSADYDYASSIPSYAGITYGDMYLDDSYMGSGGGSGPAGAAGGNGGGKIDIIGHDIKISGKVSSNGGNGSDGAGGGSGGSICIIGEDVIIAGSVTAIGGLGGNINGISGGNGGDGRIRIDYGTFTGNMPTPTAYMLQIPYYTQGTVTSDPIAITTTELGYISADTDTPPGTNIRFMTRTGVSANDADGSWIEWIEAAKDAIGYKINSPINKYIQYQAVFETTDATQTPSILQTGDYTIKLNYSYNRAFDATAPPEDMLFKDYLIFTPPEFPIPLDSASLKPDLALLIEDSNTIESRILPDETIIYTKSFKEGPDNISVDTAKDNKITYYADGKVRATYQKHEDNHLELLIEYSYDNDGSLASVNMPSARDSLDTQIEIARQQIAAERASYLRTLAQQKGLAYTQIRDQAQIIRDQINAQRSQLQSQLYQQVTRSRWVGWWIFGWYENYTETVEVPGVRDAINQLNEQERQLNIQEANSYAQLDAQVNAAEQTLNQDESAALTEVANQEAQLQSQIIREESTPVILEYYRSVLGRDPDEVETQSWLNTVTYASKIDVIVLKNTLSNSQEYSEQSAFVGALKDEIADILHNYVELDEAGKESLLRTIGLSTADVVRLDVEDVNAILTILDEQNIHFGRSAFVALGAVLSNNGIIYNLEDLAVKTVLVDIFTGSLNKFSDGKLLELSMYSLSKAASTYGVELNNTRLNFDDLRTISSLRAPEGGEAIPLNIIAHLKNNHYVVVTNIAADGKVTYREHNRGQDGYSWTVSKEDFENSWTGYAIVHGKIGTVPEGDCPILPASILAKKISDDTAMRVKGSCLPFLIPLLGAIFGVIAGAATAVVGVIAAIVTGISAVLGPIIAGIGSLITGVANFMVSMCTAIFNTISFVGTSLLPALGQAGGWLSGIGSFLGNALGLGNVITATGFNLTGLGLAIGKTVVSVALSIGISKGLEALGVNSTISGLLSSFVTGGVSGIFNSGFSVLSFITGGLQGLAIQGVNELAPQLGIDSMLTNVIGMTAGAFIGAVGNNISPITGQFNLEGFSASIGKQIMPNVASELAYYGITKAGELLGVDPRISYLAGIGIRSSLQLGLQGADPNQIWGSVTQGLLQGITSIGINYATQELGLSPLLANLGFSAISAAINAGIQSKIGEIDPITHKRIDVFQSFFNTYMDNALTFLGYSPMPDIKNFTNANGIVNYGAYNAALNNRLWLESSYQASILDFSDIVRQKGIVEALNIYGTSFFNSTAVGAIAQSGMTIGKYFYDKLQLVTPAQEEVDIPITDKDGNVKGSAKFKRSSDGSWTLIGKQEGIVRIVGKPAKDSYGRLAFLDAEIYEDHGTYTLHQVVRDGQQVYAEMLDPQGKTLLITEPTKDGGYNYYNSYGEYVDAKINDTLGMNFYLENGELKYSSLDVTAEDMNSMPTYVYDSSKTNIENAVDYTDSMFEDIGKVFTGDAIFGASSWEVAMKAIMLTSAKFNVRYGGELIGLTSTLSAEDKKSFQDCTLLKYDSLLHPYDYFDIATEDELAIWASLKSPPSSQYGFVLTAIHGIGKHPDGWSDNLKDVEINGKKFSLVANSWNKPGSTISGDGLLDYLNDESKRRFIIDSAKSDIITGWRDSQRDGIPFDVALHSLGAVSGYEAVRELKTEHPEIKIRNVYMMGSPLRYFIQNGKATYDSNAFANVKNVVNIYNEYDVMNIVQTVALFALTDDPEIRDVLSNRLFGSNPVTGKLNDLFATIKDATPTNVSHGAMWKDPNMLDIIKKYGDFTN